MPQTTIKLLNELEALGFTDADFHLVHHMPHVGIDRHRRYCETVGEFRDGSQNVIVQRRLIHILSAFRDGRYAPPAPRGLFQQLALAAREAVPG